MLVPKNIGDCGLSVGRLSSVLVTRTMVGVRIKLSHKITQWVIRKTYKVLDNREVLKNAYIYNTKKLYFRTHRHLSFICAHLGFPFPLKCQITVITLKACIVGRHPSFVFLTLSQGNGN